MNSRRSFFKLLISLAATVALAPEIAFGRKLELPKVEELGYKLVGTTTYRISGGLNWQTLPASVLITWDELAKAKEITFVD
jgi:hypothetical protein